MTEEQAFKDTLVKIGFNRLTAEQIIINDFNKIEILGDVEECEIDELVHHISRWKPLPVLLVDVGGIVIASIPM